jgi:cobalamin biosynthetic protein CobC
LDGVPLGIVDESFCDVTPEQSLIRMADRQGRLILKSFGKFWGLAGLRLGFAIGHPDLIAYLRQLLGPWPVSGPAIAIGAEALNDRTWATATRQRLAHDARRLDQLMTDKGFTLIGGTDLFRLYNVGNAEKMHEKLARAHILTRIFPYSDTWMRLGLPPTEEAWERLEKTL